MRFAVKAAMVTAALAGPEWRASLPWPGQRWKSPRSFAVTTRNLSAWAVMLVGDRSAAEDVVPVLPPQGGTAFADAW